MSPEQMAETIARTIWTALLDGTYLPFAVALVVALVAISKYVRTRLGFTKPRAAVIHLFWQVVVWGAWGLAIRAGADTADVQRFIEVLGLICGGIASLLASHNVYSYAVRKAEPLLGYRATRN